MQLEGIMLQVFLDSQWSFSLILYDQKHLGWGGGKKGHIIGIFYIFFFNLQFASWTYVKVTSLLIIEVWIDFSKQILT